MIFCSDFSILNIYFIDCFVVKFIFDILNLFSIFAGLPQQNLLDFQACYFYLNFLSVGIYCLNYIFCLIGGSWSCLSGLIGVKHRVGRTSISSKCKKVTRHRWPVHQLYHTLVGTIY